MLFAPSVAGVWVATWTILTECALSGLGARDDGDTASGFTVVIEGDMTVVDEASGALEGDGRLVGRDRLLPLDSVEVVRVADAVMGDGHEDSCPVIADIDDLVDNALAQRVVSAGVGEDDLTSAEPFEHFLSCDLCNVHLFSSHSRYIVHLSLGYHAARVFGTSRYRYSGPIYNRITCVTILRGV